MDHHDEGELGLAVVFGREVEDVGAGGVVDGDDVDGAGGGQRCRGRRATGIK